MFILPFWPTYRDATFRFSTWIDFSCFLQQRKPVSRLGLFCSACCTTSNVKHVHGHNMRSSRGWGIDATRWYLGFRVVRERKRRSSTLVSFPHAALMTPRPLSSCVLGKKKGSITAITSTPSRPAYMHSSTTYAGITEKNGVVISFWEKTILTSRERKKKIRKRLDKTLGEKPCRSDMRKWGDAASCAKGLSL